MFLMRTHQKDSIYFWSKWQYENKWQALTWNNYVALPTVMLASTPLRIVNRCCSGFRISYVGYVNIRTSNLYARAWSMLILLMLHLQAIDNMKVVASSTNTHVALDTLRTVVFSPSNGDRPDVNNVGIVITDGQSQDREATAAAALALKAAGVRMFAIGLTDKIHASELKTIASEPLNEHYFNRTSIRLVQTVTSQLLWSVCHAPCPAPPAGTPVGTSTCRQNASCKNKSFALFSPT